MVTNPIRYKFESCLTEAEVLLWFRPSDQNYGEWPLFLLWTKFPKVNLVLLTETSMTFLWASNNLARVLKRCYFMNDELYLNQFSYICKPSKICRMFSHKVHYFKRMRKMRVKITDKKQTVIFTLLVWQCLPLALSLTPLLSCSFSVKASTEPHNLILSCFTGFYRWDVHQPGSTACTGNTISVEFVLIWTDDISSVAHLHRSKRQLMEPWHGKKDILPGVSEPRHIFSNREQPLHHYTKVTNCCSVRWFHRCLSQYC